MNKLSQISLIYNYPCQSEPPFIYPSVNNDQMDNNLQSLNSQSNEYTLPITIFFKNLIFDQEQFDYNTYLSHLLMTYKGLIYSQQFLNGPSSNCRVKKFINLPDNPNQKINKTLFLDLDETLIHYCDNNEKFQYFLPMKMESSSQNYEYIIGINIRPYAREMLQILAQYYEIFIFTASSELYAEQIIQLLDPKAELITGCLSRNNCLLTKNGLYIKDLRIIKNRSLSNMIIVDNFVHSFAFQIENGVPILGWENNFQDRELLFLTKYLIEAASVEDVRVFNRERLGLMKLAYFKLIQTQ